MVPSLTDKDRKDLEFGIENDVDWVALSFVRSPKDIHELREILDKSGKWIKIIAKIEKPEALQFIDEIIEASDAIMVARGDLGVETPLEEVPLIQKMIVEKCNVAAKPVIIATQMMESMIENPRPTRAETNDVANSVMDGADALMLSAETATGKFPLNVVQSMVKTICSVESQDKLYFRFYPTDEESPIFLNDSLVATSVRLAEETKANVMVGMTQSGYTAYKVASYRPKPSIFIFTANKPLLKTMNLIWGVRGYFYDKSESTDSTIADIEEILRKGGHLSKGDVFINMASMPIDAKERTNMLKINTVK
jgi:pyruvate kinase